MDELLAVPTIGNTGSDLKRFLELMSKDHLNWLEHVIFDGRPKFVLVNQTLVGRVAAISRRLGALGRLAKALRTRGRIGALDVGDAVIYNGYIFALFVTGSAKHAV